MASDANREAFAGRERPNRSAFDRRDRRPERPGGLICPREIGKGEVVRPELVGWALAEMGLGLFKA